MNSINFFFAECFVLKICHNKILDFLNLKTNERDIASINNGYKFDYDSILKNPEILFRKIEDDN